MMAQSRISCRDHFSCSSIRFAVSYDNVRIRFVAVSFLCHHHHFAWPWISIRSCVRFFSLCCIALDRVFAHCAKHMVAQLWFLFIYFYGNISRKWNGKKWERIGISNGLGANQMRVLRSAEIRIANNKMSILTSILTVDTFTTAGISIWQAMRAIKRHEKKWRARQKHTQRIKWSVRKHSTL